MVYFCLNCEVEIVFDEASNYITTCERCNWRNEINDTPAINPITIKRKSFQDFTCQIAYPLLDKDLLNYLPEGLKNAVIIFFEAPQKITKNQRDNILHNIYRKNISKLTQKAKEINARIEFCKFFRNTNF